MHTNNTLTRGHRPRWAGSCPSECNHQHPCAGLTCLPQRHELKLEEDFCDLSQDTERNVWCSDEQERVLCIRDGPPCCGVTSDRVAPLCSRSGKVTRILVTY